MTPPPPGPVDPAEVAPPPDPNNPPFRPPTGRGDAPTDQKGRGDAMDENDGDPPDLFNGEFTYTKTDLVLPGRGLPLVFRRFYRSRAFFKDRLGFNWSHSYNRYYKSDSQGGVVRVAETMQSLVFSGQFGEAAGFFGRFSCNTENPRTCEVRNLDGSGEVYGPEGYDSGKEIYRMTRLEDGVGNAILLSYQQGRLISLTDTLGRIVDVRYNAEGFVSELNSRNETLVSYHYNDLGQLIEADAMGVKEYYDYEGWHPPDSGGPFAPEDEATWRPMRAGPCRSMCEQARLDGCGRACAPLGYPIGVAGRGMRACCEEGQDPEECARFCPPYQRENCTWGCEAGPLRTWRELPCLRQWWGNCRGEIESFCERECEQAFYRQFCSFELRCEGGICVPFVNCTAQLIGSIFGGDWTDVCEGSCQRANFENIGSCEQQRAVLAARVCQDVPADDAECTQACVRLTALDSCQSACVAEEMPEIYGNSHDLTHNLLKIKDHNQGVILENRYGTNTGHRSFDRLVYQRLGEEERRELNFYYTFARGTRETVVDDLYQTRVIDANRNQTTYSYDWKGRITEIRACDTLDQACRPQRFQYYGGDGNVGRRIDGRGNYVDFTYNEDRLPIEIHYKGADDALFHREKFSYEPHFKRIKDHSLWDGDSWEKVATYFYDYELAADGEGKGLLVAVETPNPDAGQSVPARTEFQYNDFGQLVKIKDPTGVETRYFYHTSESPYDNGATCFDPAGNGWGLLAGIQIGSVTECFDYNRNGHLIRQTDSNGNLTLYEPNRRGEITKVTSPTGLITRMTYDSNGRLTVVQAGLDLVTGAGTNRFEKRITYDLSGLIRGIQVQPEKNAPYLNWVYLYDNNGNLTKTIRPDGTIEEIGYDPWDQPVTLKIGTPREPAKFLFQGYQYDANGNLTKTTYETSSQSWRKFSYDPLNRPTREEDSAGLYAAYTYDAAGRLSGVSGGAGVTPASSTTSTYLPSGQVASVTVADEIPTHFRYDTAGRLRERYRGEERLHRAQYIYDDVGRPVEIAVGGTGGIEAIRYGRGFDEKGRLSLQGRKDARDQIVETTGYSYDSFGRVASVRNPLGQITSYQYNKQNQILRVTYPDNSQESRTYDGLGRVVTHTKAPAQPGLPNLVTRWSYDERQRKIKVTLPNGGVEERTFNPLGLVEQIKEPGGATHRYSYDAQGRLKERTDPIGNRVAYSYDSIGRVTEIGAFPTAGGPTIGTKYRSFEYEGGHLLRLFDDNGSGDPTRERGIKSEIHFDGQGRTVEEKIFDQTTRLAYDDIGRLHSIEYPVASGAGPAAHEDFNYDPLSRLISSGAIQTTEFSESGRLKARTLNNNLRHEYQFDPLGRLANLATKLGDRTRFNRNYFYNVGSDVSQIEGEDAQRWSRSLTYDGHAQLTHERRTGPGGVESWNYLLDALGNRSRAYRASAPSDVRYDLNGRPPGNRYLKVGGRRWQYDANGNVLYDGERIYRYDVDNRLVAVWKVPVLDRAARDRLFNWRNFVGAGPNYVDASERQTWERWKQWAKWARSVGVGSDRPPPTSVPTWSGVWYRYDAQGRRVEELSTTGHRSRLFYAGPQLIAKERDSEEGPISTLYHYGTGLDEVVAVTRDTTQDEPKTSYLHQDLLGSTELVTNSRGEAVTRLSYDPFGRPLLAKTDPNWDLLQDIPLFTGRPYDPQTGLYDYRLRDYAPEFGRFIQPDPIGTAAGPNVYAYVGNNPQSYVDPWGLDPKQPINDGTVEQTMRDISEGCTACLPGANFLEQISYSLANPGYAQQRGVDLVRNLSQKLRELERANLSRRLGYEYSAGMPMAGDFIRPGSTVGLAAQLATAGLGVAPALSRVASRVLPSYAMQRYLMNKGALRAYSLVRSLKGGGRQFKPGPEPGTVIALGPKGEDTVLYKVLERSGINPYEEFHFATAKGEIVSYVAMQEDIINMVATAPGWEGQGLATELVRSVIRGKGRGRAQISNIDTKRTLEAARAASVPLDIAFEGTPLWHIWNKVGRENRVWFSIDQHEQFWINAARR